MMKIYLDNAATTPLDREVLQAMLPYMQEYYGNPSSIHSFGRKTRVAIESARKTIAKQLHVSPSEIFFTSGGTEAINTALRCIVMGYTIQHAITSPIEHHAVLHTLETLASEQNIKLHYVDLDEKGHVDLVHLEELLKSVSATKEAAPRVLVSLMHGNNEIGNLLPLKKASTLCKKYNAFFHCDTVQTMGHYKLDLQNTSADMVNCSAHKFHGPKGAGFLYVRSGLKTHPLIVGGAQERNMRGGTENVYGIIGMAKAFEVAYRNLEKDMEYISGLKNYMIKLLEKNIPGVTFNGDAKGNSLYTVLNVCFPFFENAEMLLFNLDIAGIAVSGGSACSSGSNQGSHVLRSIGTDMSRPSVRFSFSKYNTREEIDYVVEKLKEMLAVKV